MVDPDVNTPHAKLTVLTLSGETMLDANKQPLSQIPVELTKTVRQLKARITSKDSELVALMFDGRELSDRDTASSLGWKDEATICCVVRGCDFDGQIAPRRRIRSKEENYRSRDLAELRRLCARSKEEFLKEESMLELEAPLNIAAYLTGRMDQLNKIFAKAGEPSEDLKVPYLFLGNYVNRGHQSSDVLVTLLAYKCKFPNKVYLLRGRHDSQQLSRIYEFYEEVIRLYNPKMWRCFVEVFDHMPLCARVNSRIFCVSGGISPELHMLDQINQLKRPLEVPDEGLLCDLLWSDPTEQHSGWSPSDRGVSYCFGQDIFEEFCQRTGIELLVRGMLVSEQGYEYFFGQRLVNVFTCAEFVGEFDNLAAVMLLDKDLQHTFWVP